MKYYTYKLDLLRLNVFCVVLALVMFFITFFITGDLSFIENISLFSFVMVIIWMGFHETLHGFGFLCLGKVKRKSVVFGAELEKGIFYCMCKEKVSKNNILIALLFPLVFIGIITYIIGLIINNDLLLLLSIFNISGSIGDVLMFIDIFFMPSDIMYLDLDDNTSFTILSREDLTKKKYFSIILNRYGKYNDNVKAYDYSMLKISKASKYFFLFFLFIFIISIIELLVA